MSDFDKNHPAWIHIEKHFDGAVTQIDWLRRTQAQAFCKICCAGERYFVKFSSQHKPLVAELDGLRAIIGTRTIRAPNPLLLRRVASTTILVMEHLHLEDRSDSSDQYFSKFATTLHAMHCNQSFSYGWPRDNFIGQSQQINTRCKDWLKFFRDYRLAPQFNLANRNGHATSLDSLKQQLYAVLPDILGDHHPTASLLHGDMWSGNVGCDQHGQPVTFDPAVYFGDPETDLAMFGLFGATSERLIACYQKLSPLRDGWQARFDVYNLYHLLNHLNIFGQQYLTSTCEQIHKIIAHSQ